MAMKRGPEFERSERSERSYKSGKLVSPSRERAARLIALKGGHTYLRLQNKLALSRYEGRYEGKYEGLVSNGVVIFKNPADKDPDTATAEDIENELKFQRRRAVLLPPHIASKLHFN